MSDVNMPKLSDTMEEGTVIDWKKKTGDVVKKGDVLAEVESDKASFELEADADGVLSIVVDAGNPVPVGDLIANIGKKGEAPKPKSASPGSAPPKSAPVEPRPEATAAAAPVAGPAETHSKASDHVPAREGDARIKASPIAARLAAELGVDLAELKGSGPEGRIVKEDVLAASSQKVPSRTAQRPPARGGSEVEREELTRMQTIVARRMVESKTTVPHFYLTTEVRMDQAVSVQRQLRETVAGAEKLTISDLVMRASALALRKYPEVNSSWAGDHIELKRSINIGFAVAQPKGLVVPVLRDVDLKDLVQISNESRQLIERARAGKPSPQDLEGGTFSLSNLGMFGITEFSAVVNMPEAAILAVGAITERPVVEAGQVVPGKTMNLTLSVDHRVLYGANGAQFLAEVRRLLENPVSLVLQPEQG